MGRVIVTPCVQSLVSGLQALPFINTLAIVKKDLHDLEMCSCFLWKLFQYEGPQKWLTLFHFEAGKWPPPFFHGWPLRLVKNELA